MINKNNESLLFGHFHNETVVGVCGQKARCLGILGCMVKTENQKSQEALQELNCLQKIIQCV